MKKIKFFSVFMTALVLALGVMACSNHDDDDSSVINNNGNGGTYSTDSSIPPVASGYMRINFLGSDAYDCYIFGDGWSAEALAKSSSWDNTAILFSGKNGDFKYIDIQMSDSPSSVSFIIRDSSKEKLSSDKDVIFLFPQKYKELYLKKGSNTVYVKSNLTSLPKGLTSAKVTGEHTVELELNSCTATASNVIVNSGDKKLSVTGVAGNSVSVQENFKDYPSVTVSFTDEDGFVDKRTALLDGSLLDTWYTAKDINIEDFGYLNGVFTTWAPLASSAKVLLFADAAAVSSKTVSKTIEMTKQSNGTWKTENVSGEIGENKYYKYSFVQSDGTHDVCDIWAKVASKNSEASELININDNSLKVETSYINPWTGSKYTEAVVYEMHIRDWSRAFVSDSTGTFEDITTALGENGAGEFALHLKDLGITHVQILPMFEYNYEGKNDTGYNWGYNPYNWNTPETRYVKNMSDGHDAVLSMRKMIKAFHDAGIAVNMDVVYNHTSGTGTGSLYDMSVPKYFYRLASDGGYSNGSGCGNETATNHEIVKKFVINSLKHWMNDYHINGFRFDLMGLHEASTMAEIYDALYEIDPKVMVYGEPWTGGSSPVQSGTGKVNIDSAVSSAHANDNGVACFNDDYRNAIKGAEYPSFTKGHVSGEYCDNEIIKGLSGSLKSSSYGGFTNHAGRSINYVECHDNNTLIDKLGSIVLGYSKGYKGNILSSLSQEKKINVAKSQDKLAAGFVFLAQGMPFINGGQEFLRTKNGNENSYASSDTINQINYSFKTNYSDVYNIYKGLIALRKGNDAFTAGTNVTVVKLANGVTQYKCTGATSGTFIVYFNATDSYRSCNPEVSYSKVDVSAGSVVFETATEGGLNLEPRSFTILKVN